VGGRAEGVEVEGQILSKVSWGSGREGEGGVKSYLR